MPGTVATVTVAPGAQVVRGEVLVTLEAMKMQTAVRAESEAVVAEVLAKPGQTVDVKDLLVVLR
jgi:pyruvate carboxylase